MQRDLQQHRGYHLREGGASASGPRFLESRRDLRRVIPCACSASESGTMESAFATEACDSMIETEICDTKAVSSRDQIHGRNGTWSRSTKTVDVADRMGEILVLLTLQ